MEPLQAERKEGRTSFPSTRRRGTPCLPHPRHPTPIHRGTLHPPLEKHLAEDSPLLKKRGLTEPHSQVLIQHPLIHWWGKKQKNWSILASGALIGILRTCMQLPCKKSGQGTQKGRVRKVWIPQGLDPPRTPCQFPLTRMNQFPTYFQESSQDHLFSGELILNPDGSGELDLQRGKKLAGGAPSTQGTTCKRCADSSSSAVASPSHYCNNCCLGKWLFYEWEGKAPFCASASFRIL